MPDWQPDWTDVVFDQAAAAAAADTCDRTAALLRQVVHDRQRLAQRDGTGWDGPAAEQFARNLRSLQSEATNLDQALRATSARIGAAAASAQLEQAAREAAREAWNREVAAELAPDMLAHSTSGATVSTRPF